MSTSSFAYNSLDRGVSRSLTFFRRTSRLRHHSNLIFGTLFHTNEELLCAKFGLLKRISSGDTKILSFFNRGLYDPYVILRYSVISHVNDLFKCSNLAQNSVLWMSRCVQNLVRKNQRFRELLADSVDL